MAILDAIPDDTQRAATTGTTGGYEYNLPAVTPGVGTPPSNAWETALGYPGGLAASHVAHGAAQTLAQIPELALSAGTTDPVSGAVNWISRHLGGPPDLLPDPSALIPPAIKPGTISSAVTSRINPVPPQGPWGTTGAAAAENVGGALATILGGRALSTVAPPGSRLAMTADVLKAQPVRQLATGALQGGVTGTALAAGAPGWEASLLGGVTGASLAHTPGATQGMWSDPDRINAFNVAKDKYNWTDLPPAAATNTWFYQKTAGAPLSGADAKSKAVFGNYNDSIAREIGVAPDANGKWDATKLSDARDAAGDAIGNFYEKNPIKLLPDDPSATPVLYNTIAAWDAKVASGELDENVAKRITAMNDSIMSRAASTGDNTLPGDWTKSQLLSKGTISREASTNSDATLRQYFGELKGAFRDEFRQQAPSDTVDDFSAANNRYRDIDTVATVANNNDRMVPPATLATAIDRSKYYNTKYRAPTNLDEIADLGMNFVQPPLTTKQKAMTAAGHAGVGATIPTLGALLAERLMETPPSLSGVAATVAPAVAAPFLGGAAHRALGWPQTLPVTPGEYYARMLLNLPPSAAAVSGQENQ